MLGMDENMIDQLSINMEINKNDVAANKEAAVNGTMDMTIDIGMGKAIADFLNKNKADPKNLVSPELEAAQIMQIRDFTKDPAVCKELNDKLGCMIEENSLDLQEKIQLLRYVKCYIDKEDQRMSLRRVLALNHHHGRLKRIWTIRGLVVDEKCPQSAVSKDVFDMSCLTETLPFKADNNDTKMKAKKLAREYLAFVQEKRRSYRRSEILRILASKARERNKNSTSGSSKPCQSRSITHMVKKVYGDVKNVHIFSYRPLIRSDSNSSVDNKVVSCPELRELHASHKKEKSERTQDLNRKNRLQNGPTQSEKATYKYGLETLVLLKPPCTKKVQKRRNKKKNSNTVNNFRNPERLLFNRHQADDELRTQTQMLFDCISLSRQLSRLKIANSRRGEDMDASKMEEASADQNKGKQEKVSIANRRRVVVESLRKRQQEAQALKN